MFTLYFKIINVKYCKIIEVTVKDCFKIVTMIVTKN